MKLHNTSRAVTAMILSMLMRLPHRAPSSKNAAFGKARQYGGQRMEAFRLTDLFKEWRTDLKASIVEFMGTVMFLLFGLGGVQAAAASQNAAAAGSAMAAINTSLSIEQLLYISTSFGLSLVVSAGLSIEYREASLTQMSPLHYS